MVASIVVVGVLTCCTLFHTVCDLKTTQMNMQYNLIWELMLYEIELGHNMTEATKNIYCMKGEGAIDHSTVIRWVKQLYAGLQKPQWSDKVR